MFMERRNGTMTTDQSHSLSTTGVTSQPDALLFDKTVLIPLTTFILGFAVENSISGIILNAVRISSEETRSKKYPFMFIVITVFNFIATLYNVLFLCHYFLKESNCVWVDFMTNIFSHSYYLMFDGFILFKTWAVTQFCDWFRYPMGIALLHRLTWAIFDLSTSTAVWQESKNHCEFVQNPTSGTGASAADLLCDILATVSCIYFCRQRILDCFMLGASMDAFKRLMYILINENVLRSVVVLCANSLIMWCTNNLTDGSFVLVFYAIQSYIFVRVINLEFLWVQARKKALEGTTTPGVSSGNSRATDRHVVKFVEERRMSGGIGSSGTLGLSHNVSSAVSIVSQTM
ncbi:hypothetical protein HDU79_003186 [Rhizoclosmatium sp. JEL0117]|nr:hypothetical protein HDU79_003186 [Rhizoclosmatium sp. JEL0117]